MGALRWPRDVGSPHLGSKQTKMNLTTWLALLERCNGSELFLQEDEQALARQENGGFETLRPEGAGLAVDPDRVNFGPILANLQERSLETTQFTFTDSELRNAYAVEIFTTLGRPALNARKIPSAPLALSELNIRDPFERYTTFRSGIVLITGNRGSGRSSTAGALLREILEERTAHVVTLQDRIRFLYQGFSNPVYQHELGTDFDDWDSGFNLVNRRDPDLILIDEVYRRQTISVLTSGALQGKLVLATFKGGDVVSSIERLLALFPEDERTRIAEELSLTLKVISTQRLVPGLKLEERHVALEYLQLTPETRPLVAERKFDILREKLAIGEVQNRLSFSSSLAKLVKESKISKETGLSQAPIEAEFLRALDGQPQRAASYPWNLALLLQMAKETNASDVHLSVGRPPIFRVDGELERLNLPLLNSDAIEKMLRTIMTGAQWQSLISQKEYDGSLSLDDGTRFRLNVFFQKDYPAAALRLIPYRIPTPDSLGLPDALLRLAYRPQGLLLITGPTGSGKTTTVACLVDSINRGRACHIITVEDPIEYYHESLVATIDQRQVETDTLSFKAALKYALRQDPDVLIVGEMRDTETIASALTAAETGHLVLATLHTNDACQTVDRIVDVFPPHQQSQIRQQVAASLLAVVSQRLLPRADGRGRVAAFEMMIATPAIRNLIREAKTHQLPNVISTSTGSGMCTLEKSLTELYRAGLIAYDEAARYMTEKPASTESR